jgi:hypothetical protein
MLTPKGLDAIRSRLKKATQGPWKWTVLGEGYPGPQLEGSVEYSEMNPILVTTGCGNKKVADSGVRGCIPDKMGDPMRACPLHPRAEDRDFIAHAYDDIQSLLDYVNTIISIDVANAKGRHHH